MIRLEADEGFLSRFDKLNLAAVFLMTVATGLFFETWKAPVGTIIGGGLALLNFHSLKKDAKAVVSAVAAGDKTPGWAQRTYLFKYYLRLLATAFVLYFVIKLQIVATIPLLLGISVVLVNILLCFLREIGRIFWLKLKEG